MKVIDLLSNLKFKLIENNSNPKIADWIILHIYKLNNNLDLINILNLIVSNEIITQANEILNDYLFNHKPLARIFGYTNFYSYNFIVNDGVFCPRNETELLVDLVINFIKKNSINNKIELLDLCCGTGVIGISIKKCLPDVINLTSIDINPLAVDNTKMNLQHYQLKGNVLLSNLFNELDNNSKFNIIVCNPPYIDENDDIGLVTKYDPYNALFANENGYEIYRKVIDSFSNFLIDKNKYLIAFEIGINQEEKITKMLNSLDQDMNIKVFKDYNKVNRIIFGYKGYEI